MGTDFRITEKNWRAVLSNFTSPTRSAGAIYPYSFLIITAGRLGKFYKNSEYHDLFWHKKQSGIPVKSENTPVLVAEGDSQVVRFKLSPVIEYTEELKDRCNQKSLKETLLHISTLHEDMYKAEEFHIDAFLAYEILNND